MATRAATRHRVALARPIAFSPRALGTDATIPVPGTGTLLVDADSLTVGANTVLRPRDRIAGAGALELVDVKSATPLAAQYGMVVINHPNSAPLAVTGAFWQATQPVSGVFWQATQPVSLAAAADVSDRAGRLLGHITVDNVSLAVTGPLTDAQLRAVAVPVSGAFFQATQPVSLAAAVDVSDRAARILGQIVGTIAHDAVDSGNPLKMGGRARSTLITAVAQDDRVDAIFDLFGRQQVVLCRTKLLGAYKFESGRLTILAAAHAATAGFFWLINPVGSGVTAVIKKLLATSLPTAVTAFPSAPRVTVERVTFTGTASGAQITPGKRDSTDAANVCTLRTASTGLTLTAAGVMGDFMVTPVLTAVGVAIPVEQYIYDATDEDDYIVLRAGEGLVFRQADAGTTSDTRIMAITGSWEER
jgi:hypothetical protein